MRLTRYRPGPGMMVTAAFIGPGTVTACTIAGAQFGYALIWALVFATITTIILQGFAVRVALVTKMGLAQAMMQQIHQPPLRWFTAGLIIVALGLGNAAYEAGNISGAMLGLEAIGTLPLPRNAAIALFGAMTAALLLAGRPRALEAALIALVLLMSAAFVLTALLTRPDMAALLRGLVPNIPSGGLLTVVALIGTTIVPYNLFLHAASARTRWSGPEALGEAQTDALFSIGLGGIVSILILSTAAASLFGSGAQISSAVDMAAQIAPVFGSFASVMLGLGLFAAGLSSAITAPLATGMIAQEIFGRRAAFRIAALTVIVAGTAAAMTGYSPVSIIFVAQIANGLLLPFMVLFLLRLTNDAALMTT
ncbi:MAG: Nramp family divalent metal transporter, partial [Parasphingorhabdus sp.]|nr:Nramp family divalent metal transporter [Parasphingorhabdus sp.]